MYILNSGIINKSTLHETRSELKPIEISNHFEMSFLLHGNLHGDFTAATFQTMTRLYCTCANDIF